MESAIECIKIVFSSFDEKINNFKTQIKQEVDQRIKDGFKQLEATIKEFDRKDMLIKNLESNLRYYIEEYVQEKQNSMLYVTESKLENMLQENLRDIRSELLKISPIEKELLRIRKHIFDSNGVSFGKSLSNISDASKQMETRQYLSKAILKNCDSDEVPTRGNQKIKERNIKVYESLNNYKKEDVSQREVNMKRPVKVMELSNDYHKENQRILDGKIKFEEESVSERMKELDEKRKLREERFLESERKVLDERLSLSEQKEVVIEEGILKTEPYKVSLEDDEWKRFESLKRQFEEEKIQYEEIRRKREEEERKAYQEAKKRRDEEIRKKEEEEMRLKGEYRRKLMGKFASNTNEEQKISEGYRQEGEEDRKVFEKNKMRKEEEYGLGSEESKKHQDEFKYRKLKEETKKLEPTSPAEKENSFDKCVRGLESGENQYFKFIRYEEQPFSRVVLKNIIRVKDTSIKRVTKEVLDGIVPILNTLDSVSLSHMFSKCNELEVIEFPSNFNTSNVVDMSNMFNGCKNLKYLEFPTSFVVNNVQNMYCMFAGCSSLERIIFPKVFNTSNVNNMSSMFSNCTSLMSLEFPLEFSTASVGNMGSMFSGCSSLKKIELVPGFTVDKVSNMSCLFSGCTSLTSLTLAPSFDTTQVTNMRYIFNGCENLTEIIIPHLMSEEKIKNLLLQLPSRTKVKRI